MTKIIIIAGPTASGKTSFSIKLAQEMGGEIINSDSMQVYSENPIISAQPTLEERQNVPHHLFGYVKGNEEYTIARWLNDATNEIKNIKNNPIVVGGTGFYLKHLIFGLSAIPEIPNEVRNNARELLEEVGNDQFHKFLIKIDPQSALKIDPNNSKKVLRAYEVFKTTGKPIHYWQEHNINYFPVSSFKLIILLPSREAIYENCNQRFIEMLDKGVVEEVKYLMKQNYNPLCGIMKSHGVPELSKYLANEWSLEQAIEKSQQVVRNYAKRQITWFKHQFKSNEITPIFIDDLKEDFNEVLKQCREFVK